MVAITGSIRAGSQVAEAASAGLKRVHLELGGKAPVLVFADADLAAAAEGIAGAGYYNAGQDCTAATRVLVHASVHDDFVAALAEAARGQKTGMPDDQDAAFGPVNNAVQLERVTGFLDRLPDHASVVAGGHRVTGNGYFVEATVVAGLRQDDEAVQDEIFGPVITVQTFTDEDEAIALANGVRYGLASSVWTSNHGRALRMSRALDFGVVWINTHIPFVAEMPHGGIQAVGLRQGPVDVRVRGLHPDQARDVRFRGLGPRIWRVHASGVQHFRCGTVPEQRIPCWTPVCLRRSSGPCSSGDSCRQAQGAP